MRLAEVLLRDGILYYHATAQCKEGGHVIVSPHWSLTETSALVEKGRIVRAAIEAYDELRVVTAKDSFSSALDPELARLSGLKTWNQLERSARSCSLEEDHGQLTIQPWKNLGFRQGFGPSDAPNVVLSFDAPDEEIGQALEEAFSRAT
jgi:hypothetical protein